MALSADQYLVQLQALLPQGAAWPRGADANLTRTLKALADELARLDERVDVLLAEGDPRQASELLQDWERMLGLPDDCQANLDLSVPERQRVAWARFVETGGQSRAYFLALAERLGEPGCTIDEFQPMTCVDDCQDRLYSVADSFTWRVNIPHPALNARFMHCNDDCDDALQEYQPSLIECPITERKPAHTKVIFAYTA